MNITQDKFPLRVMGDIIAEMSDELENGMGAAMLANIPVEKYTLEELSVLYLGICSYIGNVVQQSSAGLRSKSRGYGLPLGHVKAEMKGKTPLEGKQSNNYFRLHTDRCDMISLLSVRTASQGGHGRIASATAIHDAMVDRAPELVPLLYNPIDLIEDIGLEIGHDFLQEPGQLTFMNNHLVYHGRTAWKFAEMEDTANERDNEENGRLLLRAWISPYNSRPLPDTPA